MFQKGNKINIGRIPWNKGRKLSDESRRKISEARKGKPRSGNPSNWKFKHSEESKRKMSKNRKGEKNNFCYRGPHYTIKQGWFG